MTSAYRLPLDSQAFGKALAHGQGRARLHVERFGFEGLKRTQRLFGLKEFWSGEAFSKPDQRQTRSYQLAEVLTRNLLSHPQAKRGLRCFRGRSPSARRGRSRSD